MLVKTALFASVGDKIEFFPISEAEYQLYAIKAEVGILKPEKINGMLEIIQPGFYTSIQDLGRYGYRDSVPVTGAMDKEAFFPSAMPC